MAIAHQFDGLVMIPNCDKNVPGLLMAAARVNVPTIFVSGGPMLAGHLKDGRRTCLSHMFEAVGAYHAGTLDEAGVEEYERERLPHLRLLLRHVYRQLHELPHRGHRHGPAGQRHHPRRVLRPPAAGQAWPGCRSWSWCKQNIRPRDIMTAGSLPQRRDRGYGPGLLHQHHAPSARHRPRVRHRAEPRAWPTRSPPRPPTCATWPPPGPPIWRTWSGPAASTPS